MCAVAETLLVAPSSPCVRWCQQRERKLIGRKPINLIVGWCGQFLFFVVPFQFSLDAGEWPESQILIPDWTYFYCPGTTLLLACPRPYIN